MATKQFVDVANLSDQFFLQHHDSVLTFLEQEARGHAVEFEAWGIRRIGALTNDQQRLRRIYLRTLQQLNG